MKHVQTPTQIRDALHAIAAYHIEQAEEARKKERYWARKTHSPFAETERRERAEAKQIAEKHEAYAVLLRSGMHVEQQLGVARKSAEVDAEMKHSISTLANRLNDELLVYLKKVGS